ncbi:hypothetical protein ACA910_005938 [Epithemia clementina (nom. ined.)]
MSNFHQPLHQQSNDGRNYDPHMYVDVMSSDGVSTITGPYGQNDFDPVGVYLPPESNVIPPSYRYDEEDEERAAADENDNHGEDYYNDYQHRYNPEPDFDPQGLGADDFDPVGEYMPPDDPNAGNRPGSAAASTGSRQEGSRPGSHPNSRRESSGRDPNHDLRGTDNPPDLPPQAPPPSNANTYTQQSTNNNNNMHISDSTEDNKRNEYNARVQEWYNQMEQTAEEGIDDTTARYEVDEGSFVKVGDVDPHPNEQPIESYSYPTKHPDHQQDVIDAESLESEDRQMKQARRRCYIFVAALIAICVGAVVGVVVYFVGSTGGSSSSSDVSSEKSMDPNVTTLAPSTSPAVSPTVIQTQTQPTPSPTSAQVQLQFLRVFNESFSTSFANVVMHSPRFIIAGSQLLDDDFRTVSTFFTSSSGLGDWEPAPALNGSSDSAFGSDVDILDDLDTDDIILLVGSPQDGGGSQGSASIFRFDQNNNEWQEQGLPLLGANAALAEFGFSVALSNTMRAVIGAPGHSSDRGLVYTFELTSGADGSINATTLVPNPLLGSGFGGRFGEALDITENGNEIAVGEPGQRRFSIYTWDGADWEQTFSLRVTNSQDFGSSVVFLSSTLVAVGSPSFNNNRGVVQVFEKDNNGIWTALPTIVGTNIGDRLGERHSVSGQASPLGVPEVVVGTKNGAVERYDYDGVRWVKRFTMDSSEPVASVSFLRVESEVSVLVGFNSTASAVLYAEVPAVPSSSPSEQPRSVDSTRAPTVMPTKNLAATPTSAPTFLTQNPTLAATPTYAPTSLTQSPTTKAPTSTPTFPSNPTISQSTTPSPIPSVSPSSAPTRPKAWRLIGGPFISSDQNTGFGKAVALLEEFLFVGEPEFGSAEEGRVTVLQRSPDSWNEVAFATNNSTINFGSAIDATMNAGIPSVVVGAMDTEQFLSNIGLSFKFGSAYSYEFDGQAWNEVGKTVLPRLDFQETSGQFGASVATASTTQRIAVGAPDSGGTPATVDGGRVYTFDFNGVEWVEMGDPLLGVNRSMFLGASVDLSKDGSRLLVSAPVDRDGDGSIFYFDWNGTGWLESFELNADDGSKESLGTQVVIVSDDGGTIAFGSPDFDVDRGLVQIYEQSGSTYQKVMEFEGLAGEHLGRTLCGENGRLVAGTSGTTGGSFRVFENIDNTWKQVSSGPQLESNVTSIAMFSDANMIAVGLENEQVTVYEYS